MAAQCLDAKSQGMWVTHVTTMFSHLPSPFP